MIIDDIRKAQLAGDREHVLDLRRILHRFLRSHPSARPLRHRGAAFFDVGVGNTCPSRHLIGLKVAVSGIDHPVLEPGGRFHGSNSDRS